MLESRPVGHVFKRIRSMDIYAQSTDFNVNNFYLLIYLFIFAEKKEGTKSPQRCAGNSLQFLQYFCLWPRVGSAVGTEGNLIHVG